MTAIESRSSDIFPREKWFWLGLALLLLLAGWLYLRGYDVSLPYIDQVDEPNHLLSAQHLIDEGSARNPLWYDAYPPGMYRLHYVLLKHLKPPELHFTAVLPVVRLITIAVWMLSFVLMALIGYQMSHPVTGLLAAAIYLVNPWIVERGRFALPDGYVTFFTLLALWLALTSFLKKRRSFSTAAVYNIMLAIVFKTQAIFVAPLIVFLPLLDLHKSASPELRRGAMEQAFWNCVRFAFFVFWLLFIYRTLEADNVPNWVAPSESFASSIAVNLLAHLQLTLNQFQTNAGWIATALCGLLLWRYRRETSPAAILTIALSALALVFGASLFGRQSLRQFFTLGALLALLYAAGLSGLILALEEAIDLLKHPRLPKSFVYARALLPAGVVAALLALSLIPSYRESDALVHNFTLHDRRNDLMRYMDTSVPPGKYIANYDNHKTFNRAWGGYTGVHDYPLSRWVNDIAELSIDELRDYDAVYAIVPYSDDPDAYFPGDTVRLKSYPPDSSFRGPDMVVLRLYPMGHSHGGRLGPIRLVGYDISATTLQAGEQLVFRHFWQAETPTDSPHHVYNHLLDETGAIVAQADYVPLWDSRRDSTTWDDPDEIMLGREFTLPLPADLPAGSYQLISGLYDPETWQRLRAPDGSDGLVIAPIVIATPAP